MILRKKGSKEKKNKTEKCPENEPNVAIEWLILVGSVGGLKKSVSYCTAGLSDIEVTFVKLFLISNPNLVWCKLRSFPLVLSLFALEKSLTSIWLQPPVRELKQ